MRGCGDRCEVDRANRIEVALYKGKLDEDEFFHSWVICDVSDTRDLSGSD